MTFIIFNLMCLDINLLELLYLEFVEILGLMFSSKLGNFGCHLFSSSVCPSLFPFSVSHCACIGILGGTPKNTEMLFIFLHSFYFSSSTYIISISLASRFLILSSSRSNLLSSPLLWIFHCSYCTFQLQSFYLVLFLSF